MKEIKSGGFGGAICDWVQSVRPVDLLPQDEVPPGYKTVKEIALETGMNLQRVVDRIVAGVAAGVIEVLVLRRITGRQRRLTKHYRMKRGGENQKAESRKQKRGVMGRREKKGQEVLAGAGRKPELKRGNGGAKSGMNLSGLLR